MHFPLAENFPPSYIIWFVYQGPCNTVSKVCWLNNCLPSQNILVHPSFCTVVSTSELKAVITAEIKDSLFMPKYEETLLTKNSSWHVNESNMHNNRRLWSGLLIFVLFNCMVIKIINCKHLIFISQYSQSIHAKTKEW